MNPKLRPDIARLLERWPKRDREILLTMCEVVAGQALLDCADFLTKRKEHSQAIALLEWNREE